MPSFYSFGKAKKQASFIRKNDGPSIGLYSTQNWRRSSRINSSPCAIINRAKNINPKAVTEAGPGSYNIISQNYNNLIKKGVSMKGQRKQKFHTDGPGPSKYNLSKNCTNKQYSFNKSLKDSPQKDGPSPNSYNPFQIQNKHRFIWSFTKKNRQCLDKSIISKQPGPGYYKIEKVNESKGNVFFKESKQQHQNLEYKLKKFIPGPGCYDIFKMRKTYQGGKFTKALKKLHQINQNPAPGSYYINQSSMQGSTSFGKCQRQSTKKTREIPGPGSYNSVSADKLRFTRTQVSFTHQKRDQKNNNVKPGPGQYNIDIKSPIKGGRLSLASRMKTNKEKMPGPTDYNPNYNNCKNKNMEVQISKQTKNFRKKQNLPGPGYYNITEPVIPYKTISQFSPKKIIYSESQKFLPQSNQ